MAAEDFEVLDDRFRACINPNAKLDVLATGFRWAEGPVWVPAWRSLIWSDIPNDRMMRWDETNGVVSTFRSPAGLANGNTLDREGRLITFEHGGRVSRTEPDGSITVLADRFEGKRLNSPNDGVVKSDGTLWFTDPTYGIDSDYEGNKRVSELPTRNVYRLEPDTGRMTVLADDFVQPNGIAFSPDESLLYVADSGATHIRPDGPRHIRRFRVVGGDRIEGGEIFATSPAGLFDGFRLDSDGRIWASSGDGVCVYDPDGTLIGRVLVPEVIANVAFGGPKRNYLFICGTTTLYAIRVTVNGATRP